ncbi:RNA methyltransferase [Desulfatiferula olefinivorans]
MNGCERAASPSGEQEKTGPGRLYIALVHHPVVNKQGRVICSAVTNLDLHDIARAARTFGVSAYYVINPLADQAVLAEKVVDHWSNGRGGRLNPARREAFSLIRITPTIEAMLEELNMQRRRPLTILATSAVKGPATVSFAEIRTKRAEGDDLLLLFGTAWGLAPDVLGMAEGLLEPIAGAGDYNHLSVRSAVSIILDRLTVRQDGP